MREVERRVEFYESRTVQGVADSARPAGVPADYGEHIRLMCDLLVLALRTDSTRVVTFMFADEGSNRSYRPLGIADGSGSRS